MKNIHKKLESIANLAIVIVALLIGTGMAMKYFTPAPAAPPPGGGGVPVGVRFSLDGVVWSRARKNLVLAFSTKCRYCLEGTEFYKQLAEQVAAAEGIRLIVVGPQDIGELQGFFAARGIPADEFLQVKLADISITGTPTLVLVGEDGVVRNSWIGKLPPDAEADVMSSLF